MPPSARCVPPISPRGSKTRLTALVSGAPRRIPTPEPSARMSPPRLTCRHPTRCPGQKPSPVAAAHVPSVSKSCGVPLQKRSRNLDAPPTATATSPVQAPALLLWAAATLSHPSPSGTLTIQTPPNCSSILGPEAARFLENLSGSVLLEGLGFQSSSDLMLTAFA